MTEPVADRTTSTRFILFYALAWGGGAIAYVPLLTILLPLRVAALAPPGTNVTWLAQITLAGAVAASIGNIGFGYLSDLILNRRAWVTLGLVLSSLMLFAISRAGTLGELIMTVVVWQLALNMMLAPLAAWAGDSVPHSRIGLLGGFLAFAPGMGAVSGAIVTIPGLALPDARLAMVAFLVACCVLPVIVMGLPAAGAVPETSVDTGLPETMTPVAVRRIFLRMWVARLSVQVAEAALFAYFYFWLQSIDPAVTDNRTARVFSVVLVLSAPLALMLGRQADRRRSPLRLLAICAGVAAIALFGMAFARTLPVAIGCYALFGVATSVFLALHSAQALRVLPRSDRRGRDLGIFNLTNTVPSLIMPWLALAIVPTFGFSALFLVLAALALFASLIMSFHGGAPDGIA